MTAKQRPFRAGALLLVVLCLSATTTVAFHRHRFKKCDQSGFCRRNRNRDGLQPVLVQNNFVGDSEASTFASDLKEAEDVPRRLESKLAFYEDGIVNVKVTEASRNDDFAPRFDAAPLVMEGSQVVPKAEKVKDAKGGEFYSFDLPEGLGTFVFPKSGKDFSFKLLDSNGKELISAGSLLFENHMKKPEAPPPPPPPPLPSENETDNNTEEGEEKEKKEEEPAPTPAPKTVDGGWEEDFDGGHDSKPNGK